MRDPCAEAEDDPFAATAGLGIVLSATAAGTAGRSLIFAADGAVAAPDWLVLCETGAAGDGNVRQLRFRRAPAGKGRAARVRGRAYAVLFARFADPAGLEGYADALSRGEKNSRGHSGRSARVAGGAGAPLALRAASS